MRPGQHRHQCSALRVIVVAYVCSFSQAATPTHDRFCPQKTRVRSMPFEMEAHSAETTQAESPIKSTKCTAEEQHRIASNGERQQN